MIQTIIDNLPAILAGILATKALAEVIVNLTPTPADDRLVGKVYGLVEKAAGIWGRTAKELPGERDLLSD